MSSGEPEVISLTKEQAKALEERISESLLSEQDQKILLGVLSFNFWLQDQLTRAKLTIDKLKNAFGFSTEKKRRKQQSCGK